MRFSWAAAPELVQGRRAITANLLQETALIGMPPGAGTTRVLEQWLAVHNLVPGRRLTCNNLAAIAGLRVRMREAPEHVERPFGIIDPMMAPISQEPEATEADGTPRPAAA